MTDTTWGDGTPDEFPGVPRRKHFPMPPRLRPYAPTYDRYGRYMVPDPNGSGQTMAFTRATTVAKALDDTTNLDRWRTRNILRALSEHPALHDKLKSLDWSVLDYNNKALDSQIDAVVDRAMEAVGAADAAPGGTAVHDWAWAVEIGRVQLSDVPEVVRGHVAAFLRALANAGYTVAPGMFERIVYNPVTESVGTLDRIWMDSNGVWYIGDIKTSSNIDFSWLGIGGQLEQYASATHMLSEDGTHWLPMPAINRDVALVASVPLVSKDHQRRGIFCDIIPVNLRNADVIMRTSAQVRAMRKECRTAIPMAPIRDRNTEPLQSSAPASAWGAKPSDTPVGTGSTQSAPAASAPVSRPVAEVIGELIDSATTRAELDAVYAKYQPLWRDEYTVRGAKRLQEISG